MSDSLDLVAPINTKFFARVENDSRLSETAKAALAEEGAQGALEIQELRNRLASSAQQAKLGNIRLERENLSLRNLVEAEETKRNLEPVVEEVGVQLQSVLDDPNLSIDQRRSKIARIGLDHADNFSKAPAIQDKIRLAEASLPPSLTPNQRALLTEKELNRLEREQERAIKQEAEDAKKEAQFIKERTEAEEKLFEESFDRIRKIEFATEPVLDKDGKPEQDLINGPVLRETDDAKGDFASSDLVAFLTTFGDFSSEDIDRMTDREKLREVINLRALRSRAKVNVTRGNSRIQSLNIPTE